MIEIKINPHCAWGKNDEVKKYIEALRFRQKKYSVDIDRSFKQIAEDVNDDGYAKVDSFINPKRLQLIKDEFEKIKNDNKLQYNDFYTEQVAHPLLNCDSVFDLVFDDRLIEIGKNFFNCMPAITNVQLRKSKATNISEHQIPGNGQTTLFHCDKDSPRFIKFFFYLDNVDDHNGPFTYVKKSHLNKFQGWDSKYRWKHDEISLIYGEDNIVKCTGNVGDLIIGNTSGFHKGTKVLKEERTLLSVYYSIHPTEWRGKYGGKIKREYYERLPDYKKPLADFLVRSEK